MLTDKEVDRILRRYYLEELKDFLKITFVGFVFDIILAFISLVLIITTLYMSNYFFEVSLPKVWSYVPVMIVLLALFWFFLFLGSEINYTIKKPFRIIFTWPSMLVFWAGMTFFVLAYFNGVGFAKRVFLNLELLVLIKASIPSILLIVNFLALEKYLAKKRNIQKDHLSVIDSLIV